MFHLPSYRKTIIRNPKFIRVLVTFPINNFYSECLFIKLPLSGSSSPRWRNSLDLFNMKSQKEGSNCRRVIQIWNGLPTIASEITCRWEPVNRVSKKFCTTHCKDIAMQGKYHHDRNQIPNYNNLEYQWAKTACYRRQMRSGRWIIIMVTCSCAMILTVPLMKRLRFFFILSDNSNTPDPIIGWYDYMTSRTHVLYDNN